MCSSATTAIPTGLLDLSAELDSLGGGDARIGEAAVYCRVRPAEPGDETIVDADGSHVLVHDPRGRADAPSQQSVRRFRVSADAALDPDERGSQAALFDSLGNAALEWVLQGFNATVVAHGETGSGKTHSLFGPHGVLGRSFAEQALCGRVLETLFNLMTPSSPLSVAISCWEVRHSGVVDLLAPDEAAAAAAVAAGGDFAAVQAPTLQEALELVALGLGRSLNWGAAGQQGAPPSALPNRASLFVRFSLYDENRRGLASLHLVDLVGTAPLGSGHAASAAALDYERRCLSQHLLCFNRVVSELSQQQAGASGTKVISARDSKLTQILAPLLTGSARTFFLACVRPQPQHYLETCNTMRIATRALSIRSACMRVLNVPAEHLEHLMSKK